MLYQNNVKIVDHCLSREEDNGLQSFAGGNRYALKTQRSQAGAGERNKIGDDDSQHTGEHSSSYTQSQFDQQKCST